MTNMAFFLILGGAAVVVLIAVVSTLKGCLIVVMPNELVVLVGRKYMGPGGRIVGYRVLTGGRTFRIPLIERAVRMPRGPFEGEVQQESMYSADGARLKAEGSFSVAISLNPLDVGNAVEHFMDRSAAEILRVAQETLEGNIRMVVASGDSQSLVHDPLQFQQMFMEEADPDFRKLGLEITSFNLTPTIEAPAPPRAEPAPRGIRDWLDRLADRELSGDEKQAAVQALGDRKFTLSVAVERSGPSGLGELPQEYQGALSAYGRTSRGLEVEVVYPADRVAEAELMDGGGLKVPVLVRVLRWDGARQCLVLLAV